MEYIEEIQEQVILVGVQLDENDNVKESLDELEELADTAGAQTVGKIIQNRETVHPGTYIGKGKIEEVRALMLATDATGIICDDELSPAQMNNLEHELECKVMDRTLLILDIFAKHATTGDGILTSLKLMEVIIEKKMPLSTLTKEVKIYPQVLKNVRVLDKKAARENEKVVEAVKQVEEALGNDGRILVRESGTEPLIRVMVEAATDEICEHYVNQVLEVIEAEHLMA